MWLWAYCRGLLGFHNPILTSLTCSSGGRETLETETESSGHELNFWSEGESNFVALIFLIHLGGMW